MPKRIMKVIWKVLSPGKPSASSPSAPPPVPPQGGDAGEPAPILTGQGFRLPVICPQTQGWGENPHIYARWGYSGHNGIDFGCYLHEPVHAAGEGIIDRVGFEADGYGVYIRLDHGQFWTYYCHLASGSVGYGVGTLVDYSHTIALVGSTGFSTGPHLHWGARRKHYTASDLYRGYFNPMELISNV